VTPGTAMVSDESGGDDTITSATTSDVSAEVVVTSVMPDNYCTIIAVQRNKIRALEQQVHQRDSKIRNLTENLTFLQPDQLKSLQSLRSARRKGVFVIVCDTSVAVCGR